MSPSPAGPYSNPAYNNDAILQYAQLYGVDPSQIQYANGKFQVASASPSGSAFQPTSQPGQFNATGGGINPEPLNPMYYASNQTAQQVAGLTGGQVVQQQNTGTGAGINIPSDNGIQLPGGQTLDAGVIANLLSRGYSPAAAAIQLNQQSGGALNVTPQQIQQFMGAPNISAAPNPAGGWFTQQGQPAPGGAASATGGAPGGQPGSFNPTAGAGAAPTPGAGAATGGLPPSPTGQGSYGPPGGLNGGAPYQPTSIPPGMFSPGGMTPQMAGRGSVGNLPVTDAGAGATPGAGSFQLPVGQPYNPADQNVQNQYQYGIYGYGQSPTATSPGAVSSGNILPPFQAGYVSGAPIVNTDPQASMEEIYAANRANIAATGGNISSEASSQLNYYSPIQQQMQGAQNTALNQLNQTPGYTPQEASNIGINYSQFNTTPGQFSAIAGDPNAPVNNLQANQAGVQGTLGQYQTNLNRAVSGYGAGITGAAGAGTANETAYLTAGAGNVRGAEQNLNQQVVGAEGYLQNAVQGAYGAFDPLNAAVNNPALGFDPYGTERQLTNQDVQGLVTQAGTTVGNQYRAAEDTLERQAAAQGNTSPAALAAMRQQLLTQAGSAEGDAMTNARIAALQAQFQRAQGIEAQREGAVQTQAGMQATAATTEEAAKQAGATTVGEQGLAATQNVYGTGVANEAQLTQEALAAMGLETAQQMQAQQAAGTAGIGAAEQYGQFSTGLGQQQATTALSAQQLADQQASARAAQIANMGYQQGVTSAGLTSQGAQTIGNARIAGQGAYRAGVAQQQGLAQQGGQTAVGQQLGAYQTQTGGLNAATSSQGAFEVGKPSLGDTAGKQLTGLFAEGGIADKPQIAKLAEKGPELVIPIRGRYRPAPRMERMAA